MSAVDVLRELGGAIRGDWGSIDGRSIRDAIDDIAAAIESDAPPPDEALRRSADLCPAGGGHWTQYCAPGYCPERCRIPACELPVGHAGLHERHDEPSWRLVRETKRCRAQGEQHRVCGAPAVLEFNRGRDNNDGRGRRPAWWAYCAEHAEHGYGRAIVDGRVVYRWSA